MPQYQYRAVGHLGGVSSGVIAAADESCALQTLRAKKLRVLSLKLSSAAEVSNVGSSAMQPASDAPTISRVTIRLH